MIDREMLYDMAYALAARDGREAVLFGDCASLAHEAFVRSLVGNDFPELWFELPLAGAPWFDLHALASFESLGPNTTFAAQTCGGNPDAFTWFAAQKQGVRQLALSWDVSAGNIDCPAIQLLVNTKDVQITCDFLAAVGRDDAVPAYRAFAERLPQNWFACYTGVFPKRRVPFLRVECIPHVSLQSAYAEDASLLQAHLSQAGLDGLGDTVLSRCQALAATPFRLEFQFDIDAQGCAGSTFGASVRFASPPGTDACRAFEPDGEAGSLMRQVEDWGLADGRWHLLADTAFAKRIEFAGEAARIFCHPAFLKLRWRDGEPLDAKAYLMAGTR